MAGKSGRSISATPENTLKKTILSWEGMLVILFILVNILCISISDVYNIKNVFREMPKYLAEVFLLLPMAYILVLGEIDISVGSIVCLSATMSCMVCNQGVPFAVVILTGLLVGAACGMLNGLILTNFEELPPMIVTLATQIIFRGIAEISLGNGGSISVTNTAEFRAMAGKVGRVPYVFFLVIFLAVIFAVVLGKTIFGRRVYAMGTNRLAAYYAGIHVKKIRLIIYTVMGLMAGLCALFLVSSSYGANTTTGSGYEMDAIAMAVFGGISSTGGKGNLAGGEGQYAILSATSQATNQNAWIDAMKSIQEGDEKYAGLELVEVAYGDDELQKSTDQTQALLQKYPDLKVVCALTTVGIAAAAKILQDQKSSVKLTGLGLPSEMAEYIGDDEEHSCPYMFLWNPIDLGRLGAYASIALVNEEITGAEGDAFTAGELGDYTVVAADDGGTEMILGAPFKFDPSNIDEWKEVY